KCVGVYPGPSRADGFVAAVVPGSLLRGSRTDILGLADVLSLTKTCEIPMKPAERMEESRAVMSESRGSPRVPDVREDLRPYFLALDDLPCAPLNPAQLFSSEQPLEVEIGSGRGLFLLNAASSRPKINFLGVEYDFKEGRRGARRLKKRALPNARVLGADARIVLARYLEDRAAQALHVYFPDPWWKRRHRKRRI